MKIRKRNTNKMEVITINQRDQKINLNVKAYSCGSENASY
jgi:hypothetical protein